MSAREEGPSMSLAGQTIGSLVTSVSIAGRLGTRSESCVGHCHSLPNPAWAGAESSRHNAFDQREDPLLSRAVLSCLLWSALLSQAAGLF